MEVWQTSNLWRLRLGEEKKKKKKKKNKLQHENIMVCPIPQGDHNKQDITYKLIFNHTHICIKHYTVKLCYNGPGYKGYSVNTDFFLLSAESLLISINFNV